MPTGGDIAVDDLDMINCNLSATRPCTGNEFQCTRGSCVPPDNVCDFTDQCGDSSDEKECSSYERCSFETGFCNMTNSQPGWNRKNGLTDVSPHFDHLGNQTAYYLSLSLQDNPSHGASLKSPIFLPPSSGQSCQMRFYYHFGQVSGTLNVGLQTQYNGPVVEIWKNPAVQQEQWNRSVLTINSTKKFEVVIQGRIFDINEPAEALAIDDISFSEGCVPAAGETLPCKEGFSACNKKCIPDLKFCNFVHDCLPDKADEENCPQTCDFELGTCGWYSQKTAEHVSWVHKKAGERPPYGAAPLEDHSRNTSEGHYMWVGANNYTFSKTVYLNSSIYHSSGENCHFQFYFIIAGSAALKVILHTHEQETILWQQAMATDKKWTSGKVQLSSCLAEFQLIFEGLVQNTADFVALDSFQFYNCGVELKPGSCSPELFTCGTGHCLPYSSVCDHQLDCCDGADEEPTRCSNHTTVAPPTPQCPLGYLACKTGECIPERKFCDFTLDCPNGEDEAECSAWCDFEVDSCGWYEIAHSNDFDWIRSSGTTLSSEVQSQAPPQDHTTSTSEGHFMFILKNGSNISQIADLRSPWFSQSGSGCIMTFWYYNYGQTVGAAEMYLYVNGSAKSTILWRVYYNQGSQWLKAFVQLGRLQQSFQISVVKVSLGFYDGVTAVDDIAFENCSLPAPAVACEGPDKFWCTETKACIDHLLLCDLVDDCGDGSDEANCNPDLQCNFETSFCNWKQHRGDNFNWTRNHGPTSTLNTGPLKDHTLGTAEGYYLYIETSEPQQFENRAVLLSVNFDATTKYNKSCIFRFHYHMRGKHIYNLAIYKRVFSNTRGKLIWNIFGNKGNIWIRDTLYITSPHPFQILIEGTVGDGFAGDIAIDDLSFMNCAVYNGELPSAGLTSPGTLAPLTLPPNNCTQNEFVCHSTGHCINLTEECDFRADCSDKSDELHCASTFCDFEGGTMCGWYQVMQTTSSTTKLFHWETSQGATIHPGEKNHRPSTDHTLGIPEGWYLYADSSNGQFGRSVDILTPTISLTGPKCKLVFWNYMNGATVGSLQVYIKFGNVTHELWSQSGNQGPRWEKVEVFLGIRSYFQIILRAKRGVSYLGDVALDDISFEDCSPLLISNRTCSSEEYACANKYCISQDRLCDFVNDCADNSDENLYICGTSLGHCNFEFDLCSWQQSKNDTFDWLIRAGNTPTIGTGPVTDHTQRDPFGHYIFIESSFPQLPGQIARISSLPISKWSKNCRIIFYYYMSGDSIGALTIHQVTTSRQEILLLNFTGDQGNFWQRGEIPLRSKEDFNIIFEGQVGKGSKGDIALDDLTFTKECILSSSHFPDDAPTQPPAGSCPQGYLECQNGKCYRAEQSCDFVNDCGDNTDEKECGTSCTFERGRCGWKNSLADNFDWVLGVGSSQSLRPPSDHTLGNEIGHFLYLEATPVGLRGDKAHMKTSKWKESSAICKLMFWYYISTKTTGVIRILIKTDSGLSEVWNKTGDHGEQWNKAEVPLNKLRNFEVIFEGIRARDLGGGASVDDILFIDCAPDGDKPGSCPMVTDYVCHNGKCIDSHRVCDYRPDCEDESDETDCDHYTGIPGSCNFDMQDQESWTHLCGLMQNDDDNFDWTIGSKTITGGTGPGTDHTPGEGGRFLYINSAAQREGDVARITTEQSFPASLGVCHLRFWYYLYGSSQMGTLKVYTVGESGINLLMWSISGNKGNQWIYTNVIISNNSPFHVAFEAEVGGDRQTDIALDDISFTPECTIGGPIPQPTTCRTDFFQCLHVHQCIPLLWKCDGEEDCKDGTDEFNCPTRSPGTLPPQGSCSKTEFQCSSEECIPSLLRCDGVSDCPRAEDEYRCPTAACFNGSLLCGSTGKCIPVSKRCDGTVDCSDFNPDESSCSECPTGYCKNGGSCVIENRIPLCQCTQEWRGNRCHFMVKPTLSPTVGSRSGAFWVGVSFGLALIVIGLIAVLCFLSKKKLPTKISTEIKYGTMDNPVYGDQSVDGTSEFVMNDVFPGVNISVFPWRKQQEGSSHTANSVSFANPLYESTPGNTEETSKSSEV
ncbi:MAM and LDL-receptor class A domain-containing protein 1 [Latimeria chalumnae]